MPHCTVLSDLVDGDSGVIPPSGVSPVSPVDWDIGCRGRTRRVPTWREGEKAGRWEGGAAPRGHEDTEARGRGGTRERERERERRITLQDSPRQPEAAA